MAAFPEHYILNPSPPLLILFTDDELEDDSGLP